MYTTYRPMHHVIHMSDTHIGSTPDFAFGGAVTLSRLRMVVDAINGLDFEPEAIIHTGDVVEEPTEAAYRSAAEEMSRLKAPVYYARGNHDDGEMMLEHLRMGEREILGEGGSGLAYSMRLGGHRVFVLDACDTGRTDAHGEISREQFEAFANEVRKGSEAFSVFVHFPPLEMDCRWIDREMLLCGGEELHGLLAEAGGDRVRGVFFGHVHSGVQIWRDGILYSGVGSACCRIRPGRKDESPRLEGEAPIFFNHISFSGGRTMLREYALSASGAGM